MIIVNDGSTDGTMKFVEEFSRQYPIIKLINHEKNMGQPYSKNTGISVAEGKYILIGEDDVYLQKDYVATLLECLHKNGADLIGGRLLPLVTGSFEKAIEKANKRKGTFANYWVMVFDLAQKLNEDVQVPMMHSITLGKAETYKEILFDTSYYASAQREDADFHIRLGKLGKRIFFCPHTLFFHLKGRNIKKGGNWSIGVIRHQIYSIKLNNIFINKHYEYLKKFGMKGNKLTYQLLHAVNRVRVVFKYYYWR